MKKDLLKGFTLIELLIVSAILGILSGILFVSIGQEPLEKARISRARMDLNQIAKAMQFYLNDVGELPRRGDNCSEIYCCAGFPPGDIDDPGCVAEWVSTMDALTANDGPGWDGPYLGKRVLEDPWGHHYLYDDNYINANCGTSWMRSAGPDETASTPDDIWLWIIQNPDC